MLLIGWFEVGYAYAGLGIMIPFYHSMESGIGFLSTGIERKMVLIAVAAMLWPVGCSFALSVKDRFRSKGN